MSELFERILLPVVSESDAKATARSVTRYLGPVDRIVAVHVIEKAGGAPDKAGVEQREAYAGAVFEVVREALDNVETDLRFDTDVNDAIFAAAAEHGATAIVFTPRGGSRWLRLLTGDVTLNLVTETDRPVVVLPDLEVATGESDDSDGESTAEYDTPP
ncbi:MAG: universal stress protein [Haloarculaceae archaeon]